MHKSAMRRMKWFVDNYIPKDTPVKVLDIGSYNVNGCYKSFFGYTQVQYTGLDLTPGPNVDFVPNDPYSWTELADETFDFVISGNAFEHIEYPWLTMKEIYRVLKTGGFACILAPFAHVEHRYPVDCYRYFSDGFKALAKWADLDIIEVTVGGIPNGTTDPDWVSTIDNYDDTVGIFGKHIDPEVAFKAPRFNCERRIHKWA